MQTPLQTPLATIRTMWRVPSTLSAGLERLSGNLTPLRVSLLIALAQVDAASTTQLIEATAASKMAVLRNLRALQAAGYVRTQVPRQERRRAEWQLAPALLLDDLAMLIALLSDAGSSST